LNFQITFRDYVSTVRALQNSKPIIDGRTTNCNLASAGAKQNMNHPNLNGLYILISLSKSWFYDFILCNKTFSNNFFFFI